MPKISRQRGASRSLTIHPARASVPIAGGVRTRRPGPTGPAKVRPMGGPIGVRMLRASGKLAAVSVLLVANLLFLVIPGNAVAAGLTVPRVLGWGLDDPLAMAVDGPDLFVADVGDNSVVKINATTGALVMDLSGPRYRFGDPRALALVGEHLFVANEAEPSAVFGGTNSPGSVTELDASSGVVVRVFSGPAFDGPDAMAVVGPDLFVANSASNSLSEVAVSNGALVRVISGTAYGFDQPLALAVSGADLFVANGANGTGPGSVTEVGTSTGALVRLLSGSGPGSRALMRWLWLPATCS